MDGWRSDRKHPSLIQFLTSQTKHPISDFFSFEQAKALFLIERPTLFNLHELAIFRALDYRIGATKLSMHSRPRTRYQLTKLAYKYDFKPIALGLLSASQAVIVQIRPVMSMVKLWYWQYHYGVAKDEAKTQWDKTSELGLVKSKYDKNRRLFRCRVERDLKSIACSRNDVIPDSFVTLCPVV